MTSCILYGLTLARLLQGAVFAAVQSSNNRDSNMHEVAASYAVLFLLPLLGAIISVILISKAVQADGTWRLTSTSCVNLVAASSLFLILGGHGLKWAEGGSEDK